VALAFATVSKPSFDSHEFVSVVEVADRVCGTAGCSATPVAVHSRVRHLHPGRVGYEVLWACREHNAAILVQGGEDMAEGAVLTGWLQQLSATCLVCNATVTHIAFAVRENEPSGRRLEAISLCEQHAERSGETLGSD
jgi:hypothetical protein